MKDELNISLCKYKQDHPQFFQNDIDCNMPIILMSANPPFQPPSSTQLNSLVDLMT